MEHWMAHQASAPMSSQMEALPIMKAWHPGRRAAFCHWGIHLNSNRSRLSQGLPKHNFPGFLLRQRGIAMGYLHTGVRHHWSATPEEPDFCTGTRVLPHNSEGKQKSRRDHWDEAKEKLIIRSSLENYDAGAGVLTWVPKPPKVRGNSSTMCWYEVLSRDLYETLGCSKLFQVYDDDTPLFLTLTTGKDHSIKKKKKGL